MTCNNPFVSIIIPVFNGEKYIEKALESVSKQDYSPFETIVVDDGSTDGTARIIAKFTGVNYIHQSNQGAASARNTAVSASHGDIIAFLDSDDFWPPNRVTLTVKYLRQHPEVGYVLGREMMFLEPGCTVPPWVDAAWLESPQDASNTGVLVVRRATFDRVGPFNISYRTGEDTEWLLRANELGIPKARLPEIVRFRRIHEGSLTSRAMHECRTNLVRIARESVRRRQKGPGT